MASWWRSSSTSKAGDEDARLASSVLPVQKAMEQRQLVKFLQQRCADLHQPGLGVPDVCCIIWSVPCTSKVMRGRRDLAEHHYAVGVNCDTPAHIAAYIHQHIAIRQQENNHTVTPLKAIFCIHDIMTNFDIRTEVLFPGTVRSYGVDSHGRLQSVQDDMWPQIWVSSMLRALHYHDATLDHSPAEVILNPIPSPQVFTDLSTCISKVYFPFIEALAQRTTSPQYPHDNALTRKLLPFLQRQHLDIQGALFFKRLTPHDPRIAAVAVRALTDAFLPKHKRLPWQEAVRWIVQGLKLLPAPHSCLLVEQSRYCLQHKRLPEALTLARASVAALYPDNRAWLQLARVYVALDCPRLALGALNCMNFSNSEVPSPQTSHNGDSHKHLRRIPFQDDKFLSRLRSVALAPSAMDVYNIIRDIVDKHGWSQFLVFRQETFYTSQQVQTDGKHSIEETRRDNGAVDGKDVFYVEETIPELVVVPSACAETVQNEPSSPDVVDDSSVSNNVSEDQKRSNASSVLESAVPNADDIAASNDPATDVNASSSTRTSQSEVASTSDAGPQMQTEQEEKATPSSMAKRAPVRRPETKIEMRPIRIHQRLCKQWLDDLCVILYEDLCCFILHCGGTEGLEMEAARVAEARTRADWLRLGMLALRLNQPIFAHSCLHACVDLCPARSTLKLRALLLLIEALGNEGKLDEMVKLLIQLEELLLLVDADARVPIIYRKAYEAVCNAVIVCGQQPVYEAIQRAALKSPERQADALRKASIEDESGEGRRRSLGSDQLYHGHNHLLLRQASLPEHSDLREAQQKQSLEPPPKTTFTKPLLIELAQQLLAWDRSKWS
eukprot:m.186424 g.186424  ORF g.186424 m.186424 type:complete len:837 (-) comp16699_c0_seq2:55-2565(-)